jgi:transposase
VTAQPIKLLNVLEGISELVGGAVSKDMLKRFLKRLDYSYRRIRRVLRKSPDPVIYNKKLDELTELIKLEKSNFLKIYDVDESGFNETPCIPYGWQEKGKHLSIPSQRGRRCNVFGIMSSDNELYATTTEKSINSIFVIDAVDRFAACTKRAPRAVLVFDNAKIHHSEAFVAKIPEWETQGVEIFYLPTYSPHLNRIETLWRKCKYEWLLPQDYQSWKELTTKIHHILDNFGSEFTIKFTPF